MTTSETASTTKLALLIDGDNVSADFLPIIMREASAIGTIVIRRLYGHFAAPSMRGWQNVLHDYALTPVHVPPVSKGKNATDLKLAIEAMDILHERSLDGFCLASSDSDFTTLVSRIRENGLSVYGFGERKSTAPYVAACDRFFYCDLLLDEEARSAKGNAATAKKNRRALPTKQILAAIEDATIDDGWASLSAVGQMLTNRMPDFDPRNYGYRKLSDLVDNIKGLELRKIPPNDVISVRRA